MANDDVKMKPYIVLYVNKQSGQGEPPFSMKCWAINADAAEDQCEDAQPDCTVVWVYEGEITDHAYADFWGNEHGN